MTKDEKTQEKRDRKRYETFKLKWMAEHGYSLLAEWIQLHSDVLKSLQKVLGETRKIEDKQRRRMYVPRTKIVEEVIH